MGLESEAQEERFITLVSPEEELRKSKDGFQSAEKATPLGIVTLCLTNDPDSDYDDADIGIAVMEDGILITKANSLKEKGLLEIFVNIDNRGPQNLPLVCEMALPYDVVLKSDEMRFSRSNPGDYPEIRYYSTSQRWRTKEFNRRLVVFAPADPKLLSQLEFSFSQIRNPPESPK